MAPIAQRVRESGYEYADFKISFSISIQCYLNRLLTIIKAEQAVGKDFSKHTNKSLFRDTLDYKEIFKWIMSPLLSKELEVPANLEGNFHINCIF